jgi:virulence plasmid B protein
MRARQRSCIARLLAVGMAIILVPPVWGSPGDITQIAAPTLGSDAPKAQEIHDGDVSVATQTGALTYSYPVAVPPTRGPSPSLSLSYSSQAPIYGGVAAGWQLTIPSITWDVSKSRLQHWDQADILTGLEDPYVSGLSGGRPLVRVTGEIIATGVFASYRAQNEGFTRYERMNNDQPYRWRAFTTDGTTHYFGDAAHITNLTSVPMSDLTKVRAPLTRTVDEFGNEVQYFWKFVNDELRIDTIAYGANPAAGFRVPRASNVLIPDLMFA